MIVDAYVDGALSMADAVIEAGFVQIEGYTPHDVAERMLASPKIQKAIEERSRVLHDKGVASALWFVRQLVDYAQADPVSIYNQNGPGIRHPSEWPPALRKLVRKIKHDEDSGEIVEVSFESKAKILELLGRTDLIGAFSGENKANEMVLVIRDMTRRVEAESPLEVEATVVDSHSGPEEIPVHAPN
jgi:hypothetical protein